MPDTIHLASGTTINREDALESERNIFTQHVQFNALVGLYRGVWEQRSHVGALVAMHVGVSPERIEIPHHATWKRGGFNLVVPLSVKAKRGEGAGTVAQEDAEQVLPRIPMPARLGEEQQPGSVADKLRCEAASYIWMQRHCAEVRIPYLYGFGFPSVSGGHCVASWLRRPIPSAYLPIVPPAAPILEETGYMIIENLSEARFGKRIPFTVPYDRPLHDLYAQEPVKTRNLCRGLARTMLALARVPQPRIGAYRFCMEDGTIRLDGRPATCDMALLEAEGAPRTVGLATTYASADGYASDLARFQEAAFRGRPNAVLSQKDAEYQMAVMAILRSVAHCFVGPGAGEGDDDHDHDGGCDGQPYCLQLSDSNPGNVLVDDDWRVTAVFDLEWLFAAPVAALRAPLWLTWQAIDDVAKDGYDAYCASRAVFMAVFREEERTQSGGTGETPLSDAMDASWRSQRTWFYLALTSISGMTHIFQGRLRRLFWPVATEAVADAGARQPEKKLPYDMLWQMWQPDAQAVVAQKLRERERQKAAIERLFRDDAVCPQGGSDNGS